MNLVNQLKKRAAEHPNRTALIDKNHKINYQKLYQKVSQGADFLKHQGLSKGNCILLLEPISINLYIHLLAIFHAGMTAMIIDPSTNKKSLKHCLQLSPPDAFIGSPKAHLLRLLHPELWKIKKNIHTNRWIPFSKKWTLKKQARHNLTSPQSVNPTSAALITFTSGSTGMPKAACRTHGFLQAQHKALSESLDFKENEVDLVTLPIFAIANLASGMTSVIADTDLRYPARANAPAILKQCQQHKITRCAASPAFFKKLFDHCPLPPFKSIYTGGAPVFPHLIENIQNNHPNLKIVTVYGSTEAEPISHIAWDEVSEADRYAMKSGKGLLVGSPVAATKVMIYQKNDDQIGHIAVTGDHVLKGYLNNKGNAETKIQLNDSIWHLTGDMGYLDQKNRLWLMGRESATFEIAGKKIYPFGIECAVMHHPMVSRCAVIQHENRNLLCIETNHTCIENITTHFPEYNYLECIPVNHIPMDKRHNAKVDYPALTSMLSNTN